MPSISSVRTAVPGYDIEKKNSTNNYNLPITQNATVLKFTGSPEQK